MKIYKTTLIYLTLAAIVAGLVYWQNKSPKKEDEKKTKIFDNFVADDINEIEIENLGTTLTAKKIPILMKKDDKEIWKIESPKKIKADESTIHSMLSGIGDLNPDVTIDKPTSLKDFGLDPPLARCTLKTKAGNSFILLIGNKDFQNSSAYVKPGDKDKVYLVGSYAADSLSKGLNDYRDHTFFKTDPVVAKKVQVTREGKTVIFEKDKDNNWNITQPFKTRADANKLRDLLNTISSLRIEDFVNDNPSSLGSYGLASPELKVEVWPSDGGPSKSILVGKKKDKTTTLYAKEGDSSSIYLVGQYFDQNLTLKLADYRDKNILQFDGGTAKTLTVKHGTITVIYQKDDKGLWTSPGRTNAATEAPGIVTQLAGISISGFPEKGESDGLNSPTYVVEALLTSGTTRVFKFGKREKGQVFLAPDNGKNVYLVSDSVISQMEGYYNTILTPVVVASPVTTPK